MAPEAKVKLAGIHILVREPAHKHIENGIIIKSEF
jgi:hypothetical protein